MKRIQLLGAVDSLRRTWWKVVFGICAGLIGAVAILHVSPKQYEARAHLLATTLDQDSEVTLNAIQDRLAALAQSALTRPRSQSAVAEALKIDPEQASLPRALASVRSRLRVSVTTHSDNPDASEVLVRYRDGDANTAARLTNVVSNLFIAENVRSEPSSGDASPGNLLQLEIMTEASTPDRPVSPNSMLLYALGLLAGPILMVGWVCSRRLLSPALDTMAAVQEATDVRVLVGIPELALSGERRSTRSSRSTNMLYSAISLAAAVVVFLMWA